MPLSRAAGARDGSCAVVGGRAAVHAEARLPSPAIASSSIERASVRVPREPKLRPRRLALLAQALDVHARLGELLLQASAGAALARELLLEPLRSRPRFIELKPEAAALALVCSKETRHEAILLLDEQPALLLGLELVTVERGSRGVPLGREGLDLGLQLQEFAVICHREL